MTEAVDPITCRDQRGQHPQGRIVARRWHLFERSTQGHLIVRLR
ncbi:hypothetical protein A3768_4686 (plasmid) [Ralstonia solanacearum]|nr:hypothetical protein F504_4832 [Ralstonia pseudosolanacearum FQY_4]ANH35491.1 hypothetical protein A3768_4686 [Ralstonia solanacearum]